MTTILDVQKYWDTRPCNIRRSPAPVGSPQFFADTERNKYFVEPHIPGFAEFEKWTNKKVLEIGCGIGIDTLHFAWWGAKVKAIDLSEKSLEIARKRLASVKLTADFQQMNAEKLGLDGSLKDHIQYDLVYAFGSIHHSPNPDKIVNRAFWSLKPGGTFKVMVYNKWSWKSLWIVLKYGYGRFWKFRELVARYSEAQTGCPITHVYSQSQLRAMLERNGFTVRKISVDHIFPYDIEAYKQHRYEKTWYWKLVPAPIFRRLEKIFGWHLLVEATA